ncbi:MAG: hypothetical protein RLZZ450_4227 [Pseudomonadota bacterium]|jgi:four helix bundle protein
MSRTQLAALPVDTRHMLNHERLDVYQSALDFAALACGIIEALPETEAFLADELSRSALAIPVAIAKAVMADEHSDREHHRESALGSTFRSAAAIDILEQRSLVTSEGAAQANEAAAKVAERLVTLSVSRELDAQDSYARGDREDALFAAMSQAGHALEEESVAAALLADLPDGEA